MPNALMYHNKKNEIMLGMKKVCDLYLSFSPFVSLNSAYDKERSAEFPCFACLLVPKTTTVSISVTIDYKFERSK